MRKAWIGAFSKEGYHVFMEVVPVDASKIREVECCTRSVWLLGDWSVLGGSAVRC